MTDLFISYSRSDIARVSPIVEALEAEGLSVWWDKHLESGARFGKEIEQALSQARLAIVVWSKSSAESPWVLDEASYARDRNVLFPVSLDGTRPPLGFGQFHTYDLSEWDGKAPSPILTRLVDDVKVYLSGEHPQQPPAKNFETDSEVVQDRRRIYAGAALAAVLAVLLGFWFLRPASDETAADDAIQSIAILPFDDLSGGSEQSYFSDGLSEELRIVLSQNPQLQVAAQTSSEYFRGKDADARSIADRLEVGYLIEGSVRKADNFVRVSTQLIDGETGFERWSQSYDREIDDIFDIQTEIATRISSDLNSSLSDDGVGPLRNGGTTNIAAYDAYLRGRALYKLAESVDTDRAALAAFEQAIASDPDYAAAHAARARTLTVIANTSGNGADIASLYAAALEAGQRSVAIAPELADSHAALGFAILNGKLDFASAASAYRKSFELGRRDADILAGFATFAFRNGDLADAREAITQALRLDPLNPYAFRTAGNIEHVDGQYEEAIAFFRKALDINPNMSGVNGAIADAHYLQGDIEAACEGFKVEPSGLTRLRGIAICQARLGNDEAAEAALEALVSEYGGNGLYQQGQVLAQWGELDAAMDALNRAKAARDSGLVQARMDPLLRGLRDRSDFQRLLSSLGFE